MLRLGLFFLLCSSWCWAQFSYTVPDLRGENGETVLLGLVNTEQTDIEVTLQGYAADGTALAIYSTKMTRFARVEGTATDLFGNENVAWAKVQSTGKVSGYMRFVDEVGHFALAPIVEWVGDEVFIAQPDPLEGTAVRTTLVNTGSKDGEVFYQPIVTNKNGLVEKSAEPVRLDGAGNAGGQTVFSYEGTVLKESGDLLNWDRVFGNDVALASVVRVGDNAANQPKAAMTPPRTPYRSMIINGPRPNKNNFLPNDDLDYSLVLINTYPGQTRVVIEAHYNVSPYQTYITPHDYEPETITYNMEPFEKVVYDIDADLQPNPDLPARADWYRVIPFEGGLIGYLAIRNNETGALALAGSAPLAGNVSNLPYTPSNADLETRISTVNSSDQVIHANWVGFDDEGRIRGFRGLRCEPNTRYVATTEELFGAAAEHITWTRVFTQTFEIAAFAEVARRDESSLATMSGKATNYGRGELSFSGWEYFSYDEMLDHGWKDYFLPTDQPRYLFTLPNNENPTQTRLLNHPQFAFPTPGNFFIDNAFLPAEGYFHVGYEPLFIQRNSLDVRVPDRVALLSDYIQVPLLDGLNVRYQMRMTDPERATAPSRYGLLIQEEGADDFYWFGLRGEVLERPPLIIGDCWVEVRYRNEIVTLTPWWQFEAPLPEEFKGKRIRIGLYYDHDTTVGPEQPGPRIFMDNVRITADKLMNGIYYPESSGYQEGTFED
jgi:hypothetical protein